MGVQKSKRRGDALAQVRKYNCGPMQSLLILCGQEGTGKSTVAKAITEYLRNGASFDAENMLQVNPFEFNDEFQALAIKNSIALIHNFYEAGYETVVAGSFIGNRNGYDRFRKLLSGKPNIIVVMLTTSKPVRDDRRIKREKPSCPEWRQALDNKYPPDRTLHDSEATGDYRYLEIDNSTLTLQATIEKLRQFAPGLFIKSNKDY